MTQLITPQPAPGPDEPTQTWERPDDLLTDGPPRVGAYVEAAPPVDETALPDPAEALAAIESIERDIADAVAAPEAPVNDFAPDFRELPLFRLTARIRGWCGFATRYLRRTAAPEPAPSEPEPVLPPLFVSIYTADGELGGRLPLAGVPCYLGPGTGPDGRLFTGVRIGSTPSGAYLILDIASADALNDVICELMTARDELHYRGIGYTAGGAR